jgi:hypothetical protein
MYTPEQVEELKTQTTGESAPVTPEEMLAQLLTSKNYGGFKSSGKKNSAGAEIMLPEVSEDDFAADLATAMKISNASRRK